MKKLPITLLLLALSFFKYSCAQHNLKLLWTAGWSVDGKYIAVGGDNGALIILNANDLTVIKIVPFENMTLPIVAWHPAKNLLAYSAYSHDRSLRESTLEILNIDTNEVTKLGKYGGRGLCWSPDGNMLALGGDGVISIFTSSGKKIRDISHPSGRSLFSISWHPSKNIIAAADEDIRLFDTDTGQELRAIKVADIPKAILCVRWHPSGKLFATGDYGHEGETESSFLKFFTENGEHIKTMTGSKAPYRGMAWNNEGSLLATASDSLRIWTQDGQLLQTVNHETGGIWAVDWNGDRIVTGGTENSVLIWNQNGRLLKAIK